MKGRMPHDIQQNKQDSGDHALPVVEESKATEAGNYFVSNYPPFSLWTPGHVSTLMDRLQTPDDRERTTGLYVHIPFCRKRCHFCYFRVYTDKSRNEVSEYLDAVTDEAAWLGDTPYVRGKKLRFVYFGGGTPSFLSESQLDDLFTALRERFDWSEVEEVAFECEPGTLTPRKLKKLKSLGVTRLSLGIENFSDEILEHNNRAHRTQQVQAAYDGARDAGFEHINIDLIAGMMGETDANWRHCIERTLEYEPDAITVYQMEIPYNTTIYKQMRESGKTIAPVADWDTKRRWVAEAFTAFEDAGYHIGSAYTAVKDAQRVKFIYRDELWAGADMLALGVSSFGHVGGVHYQNQHDIVPYMSAVAAGDPPVYRALPVGDEELFLRQWMLQLKLGRVNRSDFVERYGIDPFTRFAELLGTYADAGYLTMDGDDLVFTREGLLRVDRLLHAFFPEELKGVRYA